MRFAPLAVVLLAAAAVRVWAIDFCLPSHYCRPDEEAVAAVAMGVFARDLNPHWFDWPSLFIYLTALALVPVFKVGQFLGWYRGEYHFLQTISTDPSVVYLAARLLSAGAGVLSVWLLYRAARRWFPRGEALTAAAFLAGAFLHVRDSHFGVTDVTATCLAIASFACTVRYFSYPSMRTLLPAALLAGLAASTKYNAALILLPLLVAIPLSRPRPPIASLLEHAAVAASVALAGFVIATPYALLDHGTFVNALRGLAAHLAGGHGAEVGSGWRVHLTSSLRHGLGLPVLVIRCWRAESPVSCTCSCAARARGSCSRSSPSPTTPRSAAAVQHSRATSCRWCHSSASLRRTSSAWLPGGPLDVPRAPHGHRP